MHVGSDMVNFQHLDGLLFKNYFLQILSKPVGNILGSLFSFLFLLKVSLHSFSVLPTFIRSFTLYPLSLYTCKNRFISLFCPPLAHGVGSI